MHNWRGYFAHGGVAGLRRRTAPGRQATIGRMPVAALDRNDIERFMHAIAEGETLRLSERKSAD